MVKAKLVIFRHGQTDNNAKHLMTGQLDVPLTAVGEEQGRAAGALISPFRFDKVYSSHLSRAFNTAALALEASKTQIHLINADGTWQIEQRKEIAEIDFGDFAGRPHKTDPEIVNFKKSFDTPFPNGESEKQAVERVQKFYNDEVLPRLEKGENVLIVAHAGILRIFETLLGAANAAPEEGFGPKKRRIPNATPTVYEYEDGVMIGVSFIENPKERDAANQNLLPVQDKKRGPSL